MPNLCSCIQISQSQLERLERLYRSYRLLYEHPQDARPMIIVDVPQPQAPSWEEKLSDPLVMLQAALDVVRSHLEIGDDCVPAVRVDFGTAQVAAAFGCEMFLPPNNLPCAGHPVIQDIAQVRRMALPSLDAGWYGKLKDWTEIWLENLPPGVHIQHPDIQSPFNTANMLRGTDIFLDFYDAPDDVGRLLDLVTDYMIALVPHLKKMVSRDDQWFFDWGAMWKGTARISNCSTDMLGPALYVRDVLPRDRRLVRSLGGGRVHYCGTSSAVIQRFMDIPEITGLDVDAQYHDLWDLSEKAPERLTLVAQYYGSEFPHIDRLLSGDWPAKRNIILRTQAGSVGEARDLLRRLRQSIPR